MAERRDKGMKVDKDCALLQLFAYRKVTPEDAKDSYYSYEQLKEMGYNARVELKQFSTYVPNPEEVVASALYEAHQYSVGQGIKKGDTTAMLTTYYSDHYSHFKVTSSKVVGVVTNYREVKDFDQKLIKDLFRQYVKGEATPVAVPNTIACITETVADRDKLPVCEVKSEFRRYDEESNFAEMVENHPQNFTDETKTYASHINDNGIFIFDDERFQPKDVKLDKRKESYGYVDYFISGVIDGKLVKTSFAYDSNSVAEYGEPQLVEIAKNLQETYLKHCSKAEYDQFLADKRASKDIPAPVDDETEYNAENEGIEKD
jgi:hypothetical protein